MSRRASGVPDRLAGATGGAAAVLADTAGSLCAYPTVCSGDRMDPIPIMRDAHPRGNVPVAPLCVQRGGCMRSMPIMGPGGH